jgi:dGTP triphosphohydrolase
VGTLEGEVCKIADIVAYINHDVEDAIRAGIISRNDLPQLVTKTLGDTHSQRINTLVCDIICSSWSVSGLATVAKSSGLNSSEVKPTITMSPKILKAANNLRQFLFSEVYNPSLAREETGRARKVVRLLYSYFLEHEAELPREYRNIASREATKERKVTDYIAGMTDQYALRLAEGITR